MTLLTNADRNGKATYHACLIIEFPGYMVTCDRLCGLVVKVPDYRFRGSSSIPGATSFFLRSSGSGMGSTQPRDDK
jgi:hypothetical protein